MNTTSPQDMPGFDYGKHRLRLRAAAIFVRCDAVLLHRLEGDDFWALPGGRIEPGEDAARAVVREMREELGEEVVCGALRYIVENFFEHAAVRYHEVGFYFSAHLADGSSLLDATRSHRGVEGDRTLEYRWFALDRIADLDLRPASLRDCLTDPAPPFGHWVQRD